LERSAKIHCACLAAHPYHRHFTPDFFGRGLSSLACPQLTIAQIALQPIANSRLSSREIPVATRLTNSGHGRGIVSNCWFSQDHMPIKAAIQNTDGTKPESHLP